MSSGNPLKTRPSPAQPCGLGPPSSAPRERVPRSKAGEGAAATRLAAGSTRLTVDPAYFNSDHLLCAQRRNFRLVVAEALEDLASVLAEQ
jgi:hypothetical protein